MNKYKIEISERLSKIVEITAKTEQEAFTKAQKMYEGKEIILNNLNDFEDYDLEIIEVEEIKYEYETIIIFDINTKILEINDIEKFIKQNICQEPKFEMIGVKNYTTKNSDFAFYLKVKTICSPNDIENFNNYLKEKNCVLKFMSVIFEK